jgi:hypothetical protein
MASLPDQCLPPAGTPAGTVCVLRNEGNNGIATIRLRWDGNDYMCDAPLGLVELARLGWRFVRVVEDGDG